MNYRSLFLSAVLCVGIASVALPVASVLAANGVECEASTGLCMTPLGCTGNAISTGQSDCAKDEICCKDDPNGTQPSNAPAVKQAPFGFNDPLHGRPLPYVIGRIVFKVLPLFGALFFGMFVYGGLQYMTNAQTGGEKSVRKATRTIVNAVIGIAIIMGAYVIVNTILDTIGNALK